MILGERWWYWLLVAGALLLLLGPPLCSLWQSYADERDREAWRDSGGGRL